MKNLRSMKYEVRSRNWLVFVFFVFSLTSYFPLPTPTLAEETSYTLLAPIPLNGLQAGDTTEATASKYIEGLFILIIGIAGVLAVIKIIWGGIHYMSTDAFTGKSEARNSIENALWGLLLAIGAWMILNTVNPDLTKYSTLYPVATAISVNALLELML